MKLFSASQIREWDEFTIKSEGITRLELMERAASSASDWLVNNFSLKNTFHIFCGPGNNGIDGLIICRRLIEEGYRIQLFISEEGNQRPHFKEYLNQIKALSPERVHHFHSFAGIVDPEGIIIDALFGTGLNRPLDNDYSQLVNSINNTSSPIIAIDVPSGLFSDYDSKHESIIKAKYTLTFETYKPSFLVEKVAKYLGTIVTLPIGLSNEFYQTNEATFEIIDRSLVDTIFKKRTPFNHKGDFGHAGIIAGSYGMMGAAVLASRSCMKTGAGKVTAIVPSCGYEILQIANPEVMCKVFGDKYVEKIEEGLAFSSLGIGPGMGTEATEAILSSVFKTYKGPIVLDADALNSIGNHKHLLESIPPNTILTPHPKEFERIFEAVPEGMDRFSFALEKSVQYNIIIVLKGHYTLIATPDGKGFFNINGNAGMATAGSGDVLTGIITSLLAQKYTPKESAHLGVYLHGLAGSIAAEALSQEALVAGDLIESLGKAFLKLNHTDTK